MLNFLFSTTASPVTYQDVVLPQDLSQGFSTLSVQYTQSSYASKDRGKIDLEIYDVYDNLLIQTNEAFITVPGNGSIPTIKNAIIRYVRIDLPIE